MEKYFNDVSKLGYIDEKLLINIRMLKFKSLNSILSSYNMYISKIAKDLKKRKIFFAVNGDILIDEDKYLDLIKLFINLFRNSVVHGIETEEEAIINKNGGSKIECDISKEANNLIIKIADNGKD